MIDAADAPLRNAAAIDWSRPWLAPWRERGRPLEAAARREGLVAALNAQHAQSATADAPSFVAQSALPPRGSYESFVVRTGCVPVRDGLRDFFNALVWLAQPRLKRRLCELHAACAAGAAPSAPRGPVRDALTHFDENGALLHAPAALERSLRARDWPALFVADRALWAEARLELFGHALMHKLVRPRAAITAHVWLVGHLADAPPAGAPDARRLADAVSADAIAATRHVALPVLGVPGWWPANEDPAFYADRHVFRAHAVPVATAGRQRPPMQRTAPFFKHNAAAAPSSVQRAATAPPLMQRRPKGRLQRKAAEGLPPMRKAAERPPQMRKAAERPPSRRV